MGLVAAFRPAIPPLPTGAENRAGRFRSGIHPEECLKMCTGARIRCGGWSRKVPKTPGEAFCDSTGRGRPRTVKDEAKPVSSVGPTSLIAADSLPPVEGRGPLPAQSSFRTPFLSASPFSRPPPPNLFGVTHSFGHFGQLAPPWPAILTFYCPSGGASARRPDFRSFFRETRHPNRPTVTEKYDETPRKPRHPDHSGPGPTHPEISRGHRLDQFEISRITFYQYGQQQ